MVVVCSWCSSSCSIGGSSRSGSGSCCSSGGGVSSRSGSGL